MLRPRSRDERVDNCLDNSEVGPTTERLTPRELGVWEPAVGYQLIHANLIT